MLAVAEERLARDERERSPRGLRPGAQRRVLRHLPLRHDAQGPAVGEHQERQLVLRRPVQGPALRLPARQPAVRGRVEEGPEARQGRGQEPRLPRPLRRRPSPHQRRVAAVPPAHDLEDEDARGGRLPPRHRLQRLTAVHRRRRLRRVGDPPLDHRERLARSRRRPARPALLQHRHLDLLLDRHQPQGPGAARQGPARRRPRVVGQDAARASARSASRSATSTSTRS